MADLPGAAARYTGTRVRRLEDREAVSGNLCRCTGYQGIPAVLRAADDAAES